MSKKKDIYLSVIIPCYNEEQNLRLGALAQVAYYLEQQNFSWEVIIVDDGSNDDSRDLVKKFIKTNPRFTLIENPHYGKAATVIKGIIEGNGEILLFTDLDQATPITQLERLLPWFNRGFDVVIGSRNNRREGAPLFRQWMAKGFILLRSLILGLSGINDTQCGFKAFRNQTAKDVFSKLKIYHHDLDKIAIKNAIGSLVTAGFDVEVLYLAKRLRYKIKEVPVEWHYVDTRRVNPWRDSWQGIIDLLKIKLNSVHGRYNR